MKAIRSILLALWVFAGAASAQDHAPELQDQALEIELPGVYVDQLVLRGPVIKITAVGQRGVLTGSISGEDNTGKPFAYKFGTANPTATAVISGKNIIISSERGRYILKVMYQARDVLLVGPFTSHIGLPGRFKIFKKMLPDYIS
jgi:hypothetical protein